MTGEELTEQGGKIVVLQPAMVENVLSQCDVVVTCAICLLSSLSVQLCLLGQMEQCCGVHVTGVHTE